MTRVLVSHPHAGLVASRAAAALQGAGRLSAFATGLAAAPGTATARALAELARLWPALASRILPGLEDARLLPFGFLEMTARIAAAASGGRLTLHDALHVAHDAAIASLPWPRGTDGVLAFEDAARWTFERAQRREVARVYHLAAPHRLFAERVWREEAVRWPEGAVVPREPAWKAPRKDRELGLATLVWVASSFARDTLEAAGVRAPVRVVPYGFPVDEFPAKKQPPSGPFTVLSVGSHDLRKGTPYLLEAWRRARLRDARLRLVGPMRLGDALLRRYAGSFEHAGRLPRARLGAEYRAADLLVFPTLGDGFGLVIQEAMCSGTPVVATCCSGAPECIRDGEEGWLVPARDPDAVAERLRAAAADRDATFRTGQAARARAERWTWREAGEALARALD